MARFEIATSATVMPIGTSPRVREKPRIVILTQESLMKALISGFALLTFLAASTLPIQTYAQTATGGAPTMAPDTGAAPMTTKKSKKSSKSHAKKKSKKSSSSQTGSTKQHHHSLHASKRARHTVS
jgi:hypothetical protein